MLLNPSDQFPILVVNLNPGEFWALRVGHSAIRPTILIGLVVGVGDLGRDRGLSQLHCCPPTLPFSWLVTDTSLGGGIKGAWPLVFAVVGVEDGAQLFG